MANYYNMYNGNQPFNDTIHLNGPAPLDDRIVFSSVDGLYFTHGDKNHPLFNRAYNGMQVVIFDGSASIFMILNDATPYSANNTTVNVTAQNYLNYWAIFSGSEYKIVKADVANVGMISTYKLAFKSPNMKEFQTLEDTVIDIPKDYVLKEVHQCKAYYNTSTNVYTETSYPNDSKWSTDKNPVYIHFIWQTKDSSTPTSNTYLKVADVIKVDLYDLNSSVNALETHFKTVVDPSISALETHFKTVVDPSISIIESHIANTIDPSISYLERHFIDVVDPSVSALERHFDTVVDPSISAVESHIANTIDPSINKLETRLGKADSSIAILNSSVSNLESHTKKTDSSVSTLNSSVNVLENHISKTDTSINTINSSVNKLETRVDKVDISIGTLNSSVNGLETHIKKTDSSVSTLNSSVNKLETHLIKTDSSIVILNSSVSNLETHISKTDASVSTLNSSVNKLETRVDKVDISIGTLNSSVNSLETHISKTDVSISTLDSSVNVLENHISKTDTSINTINSSVNKLETHIDKVDTSIGTLNSSVNVLETHLEETDSSIGILNSSVSNLEIHISNTDASVSTLDSSLNELNTSLEQLYVDFESFGNDVTSSIHALNSSYNNLVDEILANEEVVAAALIDLNEKITGNSSNFEVVDSISTYDADFAIADENYNVLAKFSNGGIETKEFNSESVNTSISILDSSVSYIYETGFGGSSVDEEVLSDILDRIDALEENSSTYVTTIDNFSVNHNSDLDFADSSGNVIMRLQNGQIQTKEFNSTYASKVLNVKDIFNSEDNGTINTISYSDLYNSKLITVLEDGSYVSVNLGSVRNVEVEENIIHNILYYDYLDVNNVSIPFGRAWVHIKVNTLDSSVINIVNKSI